ncbi:unnamed protein product [Spodoptera littoralis]|uniref:Uncharacterized protein n=1 Tax=Spodoptera littoralis TaxID=7109 RepID=A0A9P0IEQ9_SPOLI|nr:unnamed protein product [Spodoptera littoralis]CAH1645508.1 unnamed protein product [Spodoptera littoralis]
MRRSMWVLHFCSCRYPTFLNVIISAIMSCYFNNLTAMLLHYSSRRSCDFPVLLYFEVSVGI